MIYSNWLMVAIVIVGGAQLLPAAEPTIREFASLQTPGDKVVSLDFSPDGKHLAVGAQGKMLTLWDVSTRTKQAEFDMQGGAADVSVRFSPDGRTLYAGGLINFVAVWDVETRKRSETWKGHERPVMTLALSPDGKTLATGSRDFSIKLWDVATGETRLSIPGHTDAVSQVAFSPDGKTLASGSRDLTVKVWDVATGKEQAEFKGHTGWVLDVSFSPDGKSLASAALDKTAKVWDIATGKERTLTFADGAQCVSYTPDGRSLVVGSGAKSKPGGNQIARGEFTIFDTETLEPRFTVTGFPGQVCTLAFTPDGKTLATGTAGGIVKLWDATSITVAP